jgi:hypothetical protein
LHSRNNLVQLCNEDMKITDECWMRINDAGELDLHQAKFKLKKERYYVSVATQLIADSKLTTLRGTWKAQTQAHWELYTPLVILPIIS